MKNNNDFKWIPCVPSSWNGEDRLGSAASAEDLLLHYATIVALELVHRGSSADLDEITLIVGADYPPVIQIR